MTKFRAVGEIVYVEGRVVFSEDGLPYGVVGVNFPTDDEGTTLTIPEQFVKSEVDWTHEDGYDYEDDYDFHDDPYYYDHTTDNREHI